MALANCSVSIGKHILMLILQSAQMRTAYTRIHHKGMDVMVYEKALQISGLEFFLARVS